MWIDSHCHLHYDYAPKSLDDVLREARAQEVIGFVSVGTDMASLGPLQAIAESAPDVWFTAGLHPHEASSFELEQINTLRASALHPKCKAIGEIGLDYFYKHSSPEEQMRSLTAQLDLALDVKLPVVIHSRDAEADLLPALIAYSKRARTHLSDVGVIHCFTGTREFADACVSAGFLISFSGILTFKTAQSLRDIAKDLPLDRLMVETDCPYLAPVPHRGKRCEPSMVVDTARVLAEVRGLSPEQLAPSVTENTRRLFRL